MNLLVVTNNPNRASFRQRIVVHLDKLNREGIKADIAVFPMTSSARRNLFRQCADYDCVFLQKRRLNFFDARTFRRYAKTIIYDFDDAVMFSPNNPDHPSRSHSWPFNRTVKLADLVIAGNSYLADFAKKVNSNVEILPTALDVKAYRIIHRAEQDDKIRLVWIGSRSTLGYLAEIRPALEQIGSRYNNVVLRIICDDFFDLKSIPVEKCKWSHDNQYRDLATSDIGLAPLPDNSFTRGKCGFKILQYAAAGLPTVTSPVGVNAEYVQNNVTGYHASDNDSWIKAISNLIDDHKARKQMGENALKFVEPFDLDTVGEQLIQLIQKSCSRSKS